MKTRNRPYRTVRFLFLALLATCATGAGWVFNHSRAGSSPDVEPEQNGQAPFVVCFGHVDVEQGVTSLHPLLPGRVRSVEVRENQSVLAGAVLLRLDDEVAKLRVREAEADLAAAREQLAQASKLPEQQRSKLEQQHAAIDAVRHRLEGARQLLARKRELARLQQINDREVEASAALVRELQAVERGEIGKLLELELIDPSASVKRVAADVEAKKARCDQARRGEMECVLRAPADGTVLRVLVGAGEVLAAQPRQAAILFCPKAERIIRAEIEQEFAGQVAVGQPATVQDDSARGPGWRGKVMRISDWYTQRRSVLQEPLQFNDVRTLECLVALEPGQEPLRIGQRVRVSIGGPRQ